MSFKKSFDVNFILILVVFFVTNDSFTFGTSENSFIVNSSYFIYFTICSYIIFLRRCLLLNRNSLLVIFFMVFCILLVAVFNQDFTFGYGVQVLTILTAFLISQNINFKIFTLYFEKALFFLCCVSLFFFISFIVFPFLTSLLPVFKNSAGVSFVNLFVFAKMTDVERNIGIFREPGVFMIYINIGILIQLFVQQKIDLKKIIVYVTTLVTTLSTAGFLVFFLILIMYLFRNNTISVFFKKLLYLSIAFLLVFPFLYFLEASFEKLGDSDNVSLLSRLASVMIPLQMSYDANFLGVGLTKFSMYYKFISKEIYSIEIDSAGTSTNTVLNLMATYGFLFCFVFLRGLYLFSKHISRGFIGSLIILLIFILLLGNEDMRYSLLVLSIIFYGYNLSKPLNFKNITSNIIKSTKD